MKILPFIVMLFFSACAKDPVTENDKEMPIINLFSPVDAHVYSPGQNIKIAGTITDNNYIAEVHIVLSNNTAGGEILHAHLYALGDSTSFEHDIPAVALTEYKVVITAIDRSRNESYSRVIFSCN